LTHGDVVEEQEWKLRDEAEEEEENEKRILVRVCCTDLKGNEEVSRQEKRERERERERERVLC
jgi:siroheme synthase (precorrin-2 oxidase/ferrochelatase)